MSCKVRRRKRTPKRPQAHQSIHLWNTVVAICNISILSCRLCYNPMSHPGNCASTTQVDSHLSPLFSQHTVNTNTNMYKYVSMRVYLYFTYIMYCIYILYMRYSTRLYCVNCLTSFLKNHSNNLLNHVIFFIFYVLSFAY